MTVYTSYLNFETRGEFDVVDLTKMVKTAVSDSGIKTGLALIYAGHATGVIILNEFERSLLEDLKEFISNITPNESRYHHPRNAQAHLRSMLFTPSKAIPVRDGVLGVGRWQSIFWVEAEKRSRKRRVEITIMGE
jgi:secondary thiamine-phosphate synthase enzyme